MLLLTQPLFVPLQNDIRFLRHPIPAPPSVNFTVYFPEGGDTGFPRFTCRSNIGLGARSRPEGIWVTKAQFKNAVPTFVTILVQACKPFPLVIGDDLYRGFTCVHHTDYLALTRLWLPGGYASHD
jgi:hypothetical protein